MLLFVVLLKCTFQCENNLIIGAATGYNIDSLFTFVVSYKHSKVSLNSKLIILLHESQRNDKNLLYFLNKYNVDVKFVIPDYHIQSFRFKWVRSYLTRNSHRYCNILLSDIRDAYFQGDFFHELSLYIASKLLDREYILLSLEGPEEGSMMNSCHFHYGASDNVCFKPFLKEKERFLENNIICSGSITGSHKGIVRLLDVFLEYMEYIGKIDSACLSEPTLTDQFLLSLIVYRYFLLHPEELDVYMPNNFMSPTFTIGRLLNSSFTVTENGDVMVSSKNNGVVRKPPYVHQVDRHPNLERLINEKLLALDNDCVMYENGLNCSHSIPHGWLQPMDLEYLNADHSSVLSNIAIGKSITTDYNGKNYYFFVNSPSTDGVSRHMLTADGWEKSLNLMFKSLWEAEGASLNLKVIDVGVNYGSFLLYAASMGCKLYGFEMQSYLYTLVEMSVRINGYQDHVELFNTAVWDTSGLEFSFTPVYMNYGATFVQERSSGIYKVLSKRIDELIHDENYFFMKMDIEGSEANALKGMEKYITNRLVKHISIEVTYPKLLQNFYEIGYKCRLFDEKPDCMWPNLNSKCTLQTYDDIVEVFESRTKGYLRNYFDFHCFLPTNSL